MSKNKSDLKNQQINNKKPIVDSFDQFAGEDANAEFFKQQSNRSGRSKDKLKESLRAK